MAFTVSIVPVAPDERAASRRAAAGVRSNCSFCASRSVMNMTGSPPDATRLRVRPTTVNVSRPSLICSPSASPAARSATAS